MTLQTPAERTFTVTAFEGAREVDVLAADRVFTVPEDE